MPSSALGALNALVKAIETGSAVDQIWDEAATVLEAFAAGVAEPKRRQARER